MRGVVSWCRGIGRGAEAVGAKRAEGPASLRMAGGKERFVEIVVGIVALAAVSIVGIVYGAFLFAGSKACFRVVCGGEDFLALCPSDAEFRKSARRSAVAVWMIVAIMWCATASAYACLDDAVRIAVRVAGAVAGATVVVVVVLQVRQRADLLRKHGG